MEFKKINEITKEEVDSKVLEANKNRILSKSQMNTYIQCPMKWKFQYIDKLKSKGSPAMWRGIQIHKQIENYYNVENSDISLIPNFLKFEERRLKNCPNENKYLKPIAQELSVKNDDLKIRGFIDAVYINPKDDGVIIIDWKSGKYRPENFSGYRFELAVYSELYRLQTGITPKYWGIYFVDHDKLFFEEVKEISIKAMYKKVKKVRDGIESKNYQCKPSMLCKWCDFNDKCPEWHL